MNSWAMNRIEIFDEIGIGFGEANQSSILGLSRVAGVSNELDRAKRAHINSTGW